MVKRNYYVKPQDIQQDASTFEGFDILINETDAKRIDRLVDNYERRIMMHLDDEYVRRTRWTDRLADRIASFGGSWSFIIIFAIVLAVWILWNTLPFIPLRFDKPPFILLNLCLSFIAAFQAPIIMMSQNRQAARDKHESVIDFAINYKAEQEINDMQSHLHRIEGKLYELEQLLVAINDQKASSDDE
ncbi:DUF1003 domain-containing protein [Alicyclobacillus fastidiosus]|uniref:DUF1003 domain-containing protein n=1 Tax=Alicyclobacillus fastidiosus TaxID=392011 RepID=A0ABY6ZLY2_9BACL|nr:DUF1003 domain-containing protein [Alicyclobacillus fastidiosus]WAH43492.1 DUF1003 domain-containing protein [Alicyclobacillus fastidiosus]GMA59653.1 membrane protein [Alicyclobacillus fastidiosus]